MADSLPSPPVPVTRRDDATALATARVSIQRCTACPLAGTRIQAVPGEGATSARVVVVGEAPGATEDETGRPFVGLSGRLLRRLCAEAGLGESSVFIANTVRCRPPANRTPTAAERHACRGHLVAELSALAPAVIVLLGLTAARGVLGDSVAGRSLASLQGPGVGGEGGGVPAALVPAWLGAPAPVVLVTYHPAAGLRNPRWRDALRDDLVRAGAIAAAR